ncbi:MAG: hypothetical protein ACOZAO_02445 [Patescibacteria group bacterium]
MSYFPKLESDFSTCALDLHDRRVENRLEEFRRPGNLHSEFQRYFSEKI